MPTAGVGVTVQSEVSLADSTEEVPAYYSRKTAEIIRKYGPGPRVHFHVGWFDPGLVLNTTVAQEVLRRRLVSSQEAIIERAASAWGVAGESPGAMLDIGCGLGGGSIYWASRHGMRVRGLTVTAEHVSLIGEFARAAGVGDRVRAEAADIHDWAPDRQYDAAYACESSGYMDRRRLFQVAAAALRPGGWFGIQEHFICRPEWTAFVDGYYKTRLGTLTEYIAAAEEAGFSLEQDEDVTLPAAEFWIQSMAWGTAELDRLRESPGAEPDGWAEQRLVQSAVAHGKLYRIWRDRAIETRLLLFRRGTR